MRKIPLSIILLCLLLCVYQWRKDKGIPRQTDSITDISPEDIADPGKRGRPEQSAQNPDGLQEQIGRLDSSRGNCGVTDIWIVTFRAENDVLKNFVILDKITLFDTAKNRIR